MPNKWDLYYEQTAILPKPGNTARFLGNIPQNGSLLDFGAGSGRWSAAFLRDRSDLIIDALDQNIDKATLLPESWAGEKIKSSFQDFTPSRTYDGIFAFATLFFMNKKEVGDCFHKLSASLNEGGTFSFTMIDNCNAARAANMHGLSKTEILDMLKKEGLSLTSLELDEKVTYGPNKLVIPTYNVIARKTAK